jgi:large subunit ribosomal protein L5
LGSCTNEVKMSQTKYVPRLKERYKKEIAPALMEKFSYTSIMQVPRLKKICLNQGVNGATSDKKLVDIAVTEMSNIAGQKAVAAKSRKAISNFKLRENMPIASRVTLRKEKMYEFLDRLLAVSLPRVRDFKGVNNKGFDGSGNYTLGVKEQIIFPEIEIDKVTKMNGMDITFVTSAQTDEEAYALLEALGMPFKKDNVKQGE